MWTTTGRMLKLWLIGLAGVIIGTSIALAVPGDLIATVTLPGANSSVSGVMVPTAAGGVLYVATDAFGSSTLKVYDPPPGTGAQTATLVATKTLVDSESNSISVGCVTWDSKRNVLWGGNTGSSGPVYTIDLGDLTADGNAVGTFQFNFTEGGISLCDGLAYDQESDTLWISPDVDLNVYEFGLGDADPLGQLLSTVAPKNEAGTADGGVSGVVVGSANSLYIGRNGAQEIRRVDKSTGDFISNFAQTEGRAEDLSCDPVTYAPREAVIAKEFTFYEAFEVEAGTCPLPGTDPVEPPIVEAIPTLQGWALRVLMALVGLAGAVAIRRL